MTSILAVGEMNHLETSVGHATHELDTTGNIFHPPLFAHITHHNASPFGTSSFHLVSIDSATHHSVYSHIMRLLSHSSFFWKAK